MSRKNPRTKKQYFCIEKEAYKHYRDLTPLMSENEQSRLVQYAEVKAHRIGVSKKGIPTIAFSIVN